jgi:hypothetical protein
VCRGRGQEISCTHLTCVVEHKEKHPSVDPVKSASEADVAEQDIAEQSQPIGKEAKRIQEEVLQTVPLQSVALPKDRQPGRKWDALAHLHQDARVEIALEAILVENGGE